MNAQDMQTIRGYVQALPATADQEEDVRVMVVADDGTEYRILHKGAGTSLLANINANVEVTGRVNPFSAPDSDAEPADDARSNPSGYVLTVKQYRLTDGFDDPWYDDAVR